mgnify:CR=1 FL=1
MDKIIKTEKENIVYQNKFATIYDDDVSFPNGKKGKYIRFQWNIPYGVIIITTNKNGDMLLINQYNYRKSRWEWTIPGGMGIYGVEPETQAIAELKEETGFSLNKLNYLFTLREVIETEKGIFFYHGVVSEEEQGSLDLDDGEVIKNVSFFNKKDVANMIYSGEIDCYHTAMATMYLNTI